MSEKHIYIYGSGGLGRETKDLVVENINYENKNQQLNISFIDDYSTAKSIDRCPVVKFSDLPPLSNVVIGVGEPAVREMLALKTVSAGHKLVTIKSPLSFISPSAAIFEGVIVAPFCSVQANAKVHKNVSLNTKCIVGHDVEIHENSVVSSMANLGGAVIVERGSYVGMGALVKENVKIGEGSIIGMGSVIYSDVPPNVIVVGNPGRVSRRNEEKRVFKGEK